LNLWHLKEIGLEGNSQCLLVPGSCRSLWQLCVRYEGFFCCPSSFCPLLLAVPTMETDSTLSPAHTASVKYMNPQMDDVNFVVDIEQAWFTTLPYTEIFFCCMWFWWYFNMKK